MMRFCILGPLEVIREGSRLSLGGNKQRSVLALLLLNANRVVSTDHLVEEVWAQHPFDTAVRGLQVYISNLRRLLEPERAPGSGTQILVTRRPGYSILASASELDLLHFEELVSKSRASLAAHELETASVELHRALALWRGPALADLAYEPFAAREAARLDEARLAALEERLEVDLALGRHAGLVSELEGLVHEHPLRERLRAQFMLALYRSGRQAEALRSYGDARELLLEDLGLEPSPALQELERAILCHEPGLESGPPRRTEATQFSARVNVRTEQGVEQFALSDDRVTIGRIPDNTIALASDRAVSRLHAVIERFSSGWCIRDLGSRNGTAVNEERISAARVLRHGDEIRVGSAHLLFTQRAAAGDLTEPV
jgi:DNA-binding SARP family transcriptional activator